MKPTRMILVLLAVLLLAGCQCEDHDATPQPTFTAEDEAAIAAILDKYDDDVMSGDWDANLAYYTADAIRMPPDAPQVQGHEAITAMWEAFPPITGFTLTTSAIEGDGDLAIASGTFTLDLAPPDADPVSMVGKWRANYRRQADGSWLCTGDIWNSDAPAAM